MDPRAFNKIFPEEISSVGEFLKGSGHRNMRGSRQGEEAEDVTENKDKEKVHKEEKKLKKKAPKPKNGKTKNETAKAKTKKAFYETDDYEDNMEGESIDSYANKLDSLA